MPFTNIYNSRLGEEVFVGPFVELGGCVIGNRTKIGSHSYVCPGVEIGDDCFIAHAVMFTNDKFADVPCYDNIKDLAALWKMRSTHVGNKVRIGSGAVILPVVIGDGAIIGAGAVVTKRVHPGAVVAGNPARFMYWTKA
jgi:acetyltransferase-like isoleucine patch superfamily enzyme